MPISLSCDELLAWVRLGLEPGLGTRNAREALARGGLPHELYAQPMGLLGKLLGSTTLAAQLKAAPPPAIQAALDAALQWLEHPDHHLLTLADEAYPKRLLDTPDPPLVLYVNGNPELLNQPSIAVVGSRSATAAGMDNAHAFSCFLAERGWHIVSGLAQGIDTAAHEGALQARDTGANSTIAVMATGIDLVFPARNRALAHRIARDGALVSEFPLGQRALPFHFPKRNRLVAALGHGVLVVEAAQKSGSLITAKVAADLGREVFAIPGSIHSPLARGCHSLIKQGARLVETGQDILDELGQFRFPETGATSAGRTTPEPAPRTPDEDAVLAAMDNQPVSLDKLEQRSKLNAGTLGAILLRLELDGRVERLEDGTFQARPPA